MHGLGECMTLKKSLHYHPLILFVLDVPFFLEKETLLSPNGPTFGLTQSK